MKNFLVLLFLLPFFAPAQVSHTVTAKESIYSLGRKYNVHPRELATFNNIPLETPLVIGQVIRIPSKKTMAPLSTPAPEKQEMVNEPVVITSKEQGNPVYHKVQKKETLYHISKLYPPATVADIKKWNGLAGDGLNEGSDIVVGYSSKPGTVKKEQPKEEPVVTKPVEKVVTPKADPVKKAEPEKEEVLTKSEPAKKETQKEEVRSVTGKNFNGGAFKSLYTQQTSNKKNITEEKGPAGIFKSTSGWEDGKYYCLTNNAPAGSIVKVTNNTTQRSVYAKVLDLIPDLKQNQGMILRISNAAAEELGTTGDNFDCTLNF